MVAMLNEGFCELHHKPYCPPSEELSRECGKVGLTKLPDALCLLCYACCAMPAVLCQLCCACCAVLVVLCLQFLSKAATFEQRRDCTAHQADRMSAAWLQHISDWSRWLAPAMLSLMCSACCAMPAMMYPIKQS